MSKCEQGLEPWSSQGTTPCHHQATEDDHVWPRHSPRQPMQNHYAVTTDGIRGEGDNIWTELTIKNG